MYTVSIIVPVYNAEKYVGKCVDSIINQTIKNIEIILVNDGSTDNSLDICRKYEKENDNVKVISTENRGVSSARNIGIESSTGKYVMFVDSDDYIDENMVEEMLKKIENDNSDLCICNYIKENENSKVKVSCFNDNGILDKEKINKLIIDLIESSNDEKEHLLAGSRGPWGKLFKKQLIEEYNIRFNSELIIGEDFLFNLEYLIKCNSANISEGNYYHYITNMNSATMKYKEMCWSNIYKNTISSLISFLEENDVFDESKDRVYKLIIKYFFMCIYNEMLKGNPHDFSYKQKQIKYMCRDKYIKEALHNYKSWYVSTKERIVINLAKHNIYYFIYPLMKLNFNKFISKRKKPV